MMLNFKDYLKDKKSVALILFIILGVFIRVQELGYSNLQGDEINPLDYVYDENFIRYILNQKRGPLQYLINFINTSLFGYINELQIRLPYLIFALVGFYTLYLLARKIFDQKAALYGLALLAINGLFIAFSRIAQYQSFLFFSLPLTGWLFINYFETGNRRRLIYAASIYAFSLLAHYDALSMAPFFPFFLASRYLKEPSKLKRYLKDAAIFSTIALAPNLIFYCAMRLNPYYEDVTRTYLSNRLLHGELMPRLPDIMPIVSLYIPQHYLLVLLILLTLGLIFLRDRVSEIRFFRVLLSRRFVKTVYILLSVTLAAATIFSYYPIKPRASTLLVCGASLGITTILLLSKNIESAVLGLTGWTLFPFCVYFFLIRDPRTHVYTVFLPGFILAGHGIKELIDSKIFNFKFATHKYFGLAVRSALFTAIIALLAFESGVIWQMFVDKTPEYPWWEKEFLGRKIYDVRHAYHEKPEGVFGVSYYRGWEKFGEGIKKGCLKGSFYSNEKDSISYWYTRKHQADKDNTDNLVLVEGPHSWRFIEESGYKKEELDRDGYALVKTIKSKHGLPVMYIWGKKDLYPEKEPFCSF